MNQLQPTDEQMEHAPLVYAVLRTPAGLGPNDPLWHKVVTVGNKEFEAWYRQVIQEAAAESGGDPALVEVKGVVRPPLAGPLVTQFFVELSAGLAVPILTNFTYLIKDRLTKKLAQEDIPPDTLLLWFSPTALEELARKYVRRQGHPRAELTTTRELFNTVISGGYPRRIDATKPSGWEITVSTNTVTFTFIVDSAAAVLQATRQEGQECLELAITSLLEDEI